MLVAAGDPVCQHVRQIVRTTAASAAVIALIINQAHHVYYLAALAVASASG